MDDAAEKSNEYSKRPLWQWVLIYIVIGGIVYALIYYFIFAKKSGYSTGQNPYPTTQSNTTSPIPTSKSETVKIALEGNEFAFTPATITVKKGQPVELTFKNVGKFPHNFSISDLSVQTKTIQPGQSDVVTFTPDKTGSFTYTCTVPGHADKGMKGTLIVE